MLKFSDYELPEQTLTMFQRRLPIDDGQLWILCPAGVGDNLLLMGKQWKTAQERDVTFCLPQAEQKRSGDLFRMMGLKYCYLPGLTTNWVWSRPGSPPIPDSGAVLSIQPNKHLENGHRIEKWYPDIPFRNPTEFMESKAVLYKQAVGSPRYVVVFTCRQGYMEEGGNLHAGTWARICRQLEAEIAPVCLLGAGDDVPFIEKILDRFEPSVEPILNAPLDVVTTALLGAQMAVGVASGPMMLATYLGIPTYQAWPHHLTKMIATWQQPEAVWGACFLDELEIKVRDGLQFNGIADIPTDPADESIAVCGEVGEQWKKDEVPIEEPKPRRIVREPSRYEPTGKTNNSEPAKVPVLAEGI